MNSHLSRPAKGGGLIAAFLAHSNKLGGAERSTIELAAEDGSRGNPWLVLARDCGTGPVEDLCAELGVPYIAVRNPARVISELRRRSPEAVWAFGLRWSLFLRISLRVGLMRHSPNGRPLVLVAQRGLDAWRRPWHDLLDRWTQRFADAFVANSVAASEMLIDKVGIDPRRVFTIRTGVSDSWLSAGARVRTLPPGLTRILLVGNNRAEKAYDDALAILGRLRDPLWGATIFTNDLGTLPSQIRLRGLEDKVTVVVGHRLSTDDYDRHDLLLHVSHSESLPRAVLEATARGLAVVATNVGDVASVVPTTGLFPAGDIEAGVVTLERAIASTDSSNTTARSGAAVRRQVAVADDLRALVRTLSSATPDRWERAGQAAFRRRR